RVTVEPSRTFYGAVAEPGCSSVGRTPPALPGADRFPLLSTYSDLRPCPSLSPQPDKCPSRKDDGESDVPAHSHSSAACRCRARPVKDDAFQTSGRPLRR